MIGLYMGCLLHYMIPFQNLFQMLFMSLFTDYCWLQAIQSSLNLNEFKMLLFSTDIRPICDYSMADIFELFDW